MSNNDPAKQFVELIRNSFSSSFTADALISSLGTSLGMSAAIVLLFCLLRPLNTVVYAPKLRVMDEKHAPPKISKGLLSWITPLYTEKEDRLLEMIGLDAIVFLRFLRMCRNMFLVLGIVCSAVIIPVNVLSSRKNYWVGAPTAPLVVMTPVMAWGEGMWAHVVVAYIIDIVVMVFLWLNYRSIARLAQHYFRTEDYQNSQHSKTLMIADIPKKYQKDLGLAEITNKIKPASGDEVFAIGRSVKGLPELIEKHEEIVRQLEIVLAKYLRDPNRLPAKRPVCRPHEDDRKNLPSKVDAIEYLNRRMKDLESRIYHARHSIENKKAMPFGFVSYGTIQQAHIAAKASKGKGKNGTFVALAPRPIDILWDNLSTSRAKRRSNAYIGYALFTALSVVYVVPNAIIATFLSDIGRIGIFWKEFDDVLRRNPKFFAFL
jgi:calcium permeable stress-gated cation channel